MKSQGFSQTPQDIMGSTMGVLSPSTLATLYSGIDLLIRGGN